MKYSVGQVIYVILNKKGQVYPMRIIEEITKKTLKGEDINYVLQVGSDTSTTILLNDVEGDIFNTADEARSVLIDRATQQIERIVASATAKAKEWYSSAESTVDEVEVHELSQPEFQQFSTVKLPDGSVARLKMSNDK